MGNPTFPPIQTQADIQSLVNFLTDTSGSGAAYAGTAGGLDGLVLPRSFYDTADYWGGYVCSIDGNNCSVTDVYNSSDYTLTPSSTSPGMALQIERVDAHYGIDIYDAACWQIAIQLAANDGLSAQGGSSLEGVADNQTTLLTLGYDGNAPNSPPPAANANRATSSTFTYGGAVISNPENAYFFRMITRNWQSVDPFTNTSYQQEYISTSGMLPSNYAAGQMTWMDWKPITGENAWAFLIGPLQAAYLRDVVAGGKSYVDFNDPAIQNATSVLYAFVRMQSPLGALYYAAAGSLGNTGDQPVDPNEVSVENNASTLAGLLTLQNLLELSLENQYQGSNQAVSDTLTTIDAMVNGGTTDQGKTQGILAFFQNYAWDEANGVFYQGGLANAPNQADWVPTTEPMAVDVNTWGVAVLGVPLVDKWFGDLSAYTIWQNVKAWGGYYGGGTSGDIWGVGYSDQDGHQIFSAEWTAGAINMVRCLITQYTAIDPQKYAAQIASLQADEQSMQKYLLTLRSDNYPSEAAFASVRPPNYDTLVSLPKGSLAFEYANQRYAIPFGWYANPLPSTTSTAWPIMLYYQHNPLRFDGSYEANF